MRQQIPLNPLFSKGGFQLSLEFLNEFLRQDTRLMEAQNDPRFLKGIDEFNQKLFFECHETLEEIWLEDHGEDRKFYQGIIQIAAGYFKWQQGVPAGAIKLWRAGLEKVEPYGPAHFGIHVDSLAQAVKLNLAELEAAQESGSALVLDIPTIHLVC